MSILAQQQQGTTAVGAFVRDGNGGAVLELGNILDLFRVATDGFNMHTDHGDQVGALALVEVFQVRQGLEVVGVQTLLGHFL